MTDDEKRLRQALETLERGELQICWAKVKQDQDTGDKRVLYENLWELTDGTSESSPAPAETVDDMVLIPRAELQQVFEVITEFNGMPMSLRQSLTVIQAIDTLRSRLTQPTSLE